jgi:hypothetical protein
MTGSQYSSLVAGYVAARFASRDLNVYREVRIGKSIIGKNRSVDILCVCQSQELAFAIECKLQESQGTVDEKIPYALDDMRASPVPGCLVYAGNGFSKGVLHMLSAARDAAYCLPHKNQAAPTPSTRELDHLLAAHFRWWDVLVEGKRPI